MLFPVGEKSLFGRQYASAAFKEHAGKVIEKAGDVIDKTGAAIDGFVDGLKSDDKSKDK